MNRLMTGTLLLALLLAGCATGTEPGAGGSSSDEGDNGEATIQSVTLPPATPEPGATIEIPATLSDAAPTTEGTTEEIASMTPTRNTRNNSGSSSGVPPEEGATGTPQPSVPLDPTGTIPPRPTGDAGGPGTFPTPANESEAALILVARESGLPLDDLTLSRRTRVIWPDTSLGCPQRGVEYEPVPIPGIQYVITGGGQSYYVHSDQKGKLFLCEEPKPAGPQE